MIESIPISCWKDILRECLIEKSLPANLVEKIDLRWFQNIANERIAIQMAFDGKKLDTYYINPYQGDMAAQFVYVLRQAADTIKNDIAKPAKPTKHKRAKVTIASRFRPKVHYKPSWER